MASYSLNPDFQQFLQNAAKVLDKTAQSDKGPLEVSLMAAHTAQLLNEWLQQPGSATNYASLLETKLGSVLRLPPAEAVQAAIAWSELASRNASSTGYGFTKFVVASMLLRTRIHGHAVEARFESTVSRASQRAEIGEYTDAIDVLQSALHATDQPAELAAALHLAALLVCKPPDSEH